MANKDWSWKKLGVPQGVVDEHKADPERPFRMEDPPVKFDDAYFEERIRPYRILPDSPIPPVSYLAAMREWMLLHPNEIALIAYFLIVVIILLCQ